MSKIKFRLEVWDKTVVFKVLEMDERFRSRAGLESKAYHSKVGLDVVSEDSPELTLYTVLLRGKIERQDFHVATLQLKSKTEAEDYCQKVVTALLDWVENWFAWLGEPEAEDDTTNVFEF